MNVYISVQVQIQIHLTKHREHTSKRPLKQQKSFDFRSALQQFGGGTHLKDSMIMGVAYTMGAVKDSPNVIDNGYLGIHNIESTRVLPVHFLPNNMIYRYVIKNYFIYELIQYIAYIYSIEYDNI